jgi:hypothetical protein
MTIRDIAAVTGIGETAYTDRARPVTPAWSFSLRQR